jgi:hypothetical protein
MLTYKILSQGRKKIARGRKGRGLLVNTSK